MNQTIIKDRDGKPYTFCQYEDSHDGGWGYCILRDGDGLAHFYQEYSAITRHDIYRKVQATVSNNLPRSSVYGWIENPSLNMDPTIRLRTTCLQRTGTCLFGCVVAETPYGEIGSVAEQRPVDAVLCMSKRIEQYERIHNLKAVVEDITLDSWMRLLPDLPDYHETVSMIRKAREIWESSSTESVKEMAWNLYILALGQAGYGFDRV